MKYFILPCLVLFFCMTFAAPLQASSIVTTAEAGGAQSEQSGFDIVKSTQDQILGALAPWLEKITKGKIKVAEAKKLFTVAKGLKGLAKFFGGGLDCINAFKSGWDIGTAIDNCISAIKKDDFSGFTKHFNSFAQATVKGIVAIGTTALVTAAGGAGVPVLAIVGVGLAIGVATDYLTSKIDLKKPLEWAKKGMGLLREGRVPERHHRKSLAADGIRQYRRRTIEARCAARQAAETSSPLKESPASMPNDLKTRLRELCRDASGAVTMEYVLLCLLVSASSLLAVIAFSRSIMDMTHTVTYAMTGQTQKASNALKEDRKDRAQDFKQAAQWSDSLHR